MEKIADKLPDIYFDWYARFLPGVVAAFAMLFYMPEIRSAALRHTAELTPHGLLPEFHIWRAFIWRESWGNGARWEGRRQG